MKRVATYVDGLNLYHGVKDMIHHGGLAASWKWLDLDALIHRLSPRDSDTTIQYFTAHVIGPPSDSYESRPWSRVNFPSYCETNEVRFTNHSVGEDKGPPFGGPEPGDLGRRGGTQ